MAKKLLLFFRSLQNTVLQISHVHLGRGQPPPKEKQANAGLPGALLGSRELGAYSPGHSGYETAEELLRQGLGEASPGQRGLVDDHGAVQEVGAGITGQGDVTADSDRHSAETTGCAVTRGRQQAESSESFRGLALSWNLSN